MKKRCTKTALPCGSSILPLEEYCFWTDHGDLQLNPFLFGGSCPGHLQSTPEFGLSRKAGIEAKVSIMRTDMYPYE